MGWIYTHRPKGQTIREFFEQQFGDTYGEIVDLSTVNRNTVYILWRKKARNIFGFHHPEELVALVILVRYCPKDRYYNFGYKDMDESMGPYEADCPARILEKLSPPCNRYAWDWRQRCWRNIQRRKSQPKLQVGHILVFKKPMIFSDKAKRSVFKVTSTKPLQFVDDRFYGVRLRRDTLRAHENYQVFTREEYSDYLDKIAEKIEQEEAV